MYSCFSDDIWGNYDPCRTHWLNPGRFFLVPYRKNLWIFLPTVLLHISSIGSPLHSVPIAIPACQCGCRTYQYPGQCLQILNIFIYIYIYICKIFSNFATTNILTQQIKVKMSGNNWMANVKIVRCSIWTQVTSGAWSRDEYWSVDGKASNNLQSLITVREFSQLFTLSVFSPHIS